MGLGLLIGLGALLFAFAGSDDKPRLPPTPGGAPPPPGPGPSPPPGGRAPPGTTRPTQAEIDDFAIELQEFLAPWLQGECAALMVSEGNPPDVVAEYIVLLQQAYIRAYRSNVASGMGLEDAANAALDNPALQCGVFIPAGWEQTP